MAIQKGVMECIRLMDHGKLDEAAANVRKLKQEYEATFGKNNVLGQTSTGYKVILELEQDIKKAQGDAKLVEEESLHQAERALS